MKNILRIFQLGLGVGLLVYAFTTGMFDWTKISHLLAMPSVAAVNLLIIFVAVLLLTRRWGMFVHATGIKIPFWRVFQIHMTSSFLSTFMPGAVGSDLAKIGVGMRSNPTEKKKMLASIVLDRGVGVLVMVIIPGVICLWYLVQGETPPISRAMSWGLALFSLALFIGTPVFYKFVIPILERSETPKIRLAAQILGHHLGTGLGAIGISVLSTGLALVQYQYQAMSVGLPTDFAKIAVIVPIGLLASALSILPLGIGVGQVAFFHLFKWAFGNGEAGVTVVTAVQSYTLLWNLFGIPFYFILTHKPAPELKKTA